MRVAMLVGMLIFNVLVGFYGSGLAWNASTDAGLSTAPEVQASDDMAPPPPNWP